MHKHPQYITNHNINCSEMRLIDDKGIQIGIISKTEALQKAESENKDLVLITSKTQPPIVKLISLSKFLYQEKKKIQQARKGIKKSTIKDVKLSLFIGQNDLNRMIEKTKYFLDTGHQVRLNLPLKGRELGKKSMAFELIQKAISNITNANISVAPKFQGRVLIAILTKKTST